MSHKKICDGCGVEEEKKTPLQVYGKSDGDYFDLCPQCKVEFEEYLGTFRPEIESAIQALKNIRGKLFDGWLAWKQKLQALHEEGGKSNGS